MLVVSLALSLAAADAVATPVGNWQIAKSRFPCSIAREFAVGDRRLIIQMQPSADRTDYAINLIGPKGIIPVVDGGMKAIDFTIGTESAAVPGYSRDTVDGRRIIRTLLPQSFWDRIARGAADITVSFAKTRISLPGAAIGEATAALKACHGGALSALGVDPAAWFEGRVAKPLNAGRWFGADARKGISGGAAGQAIALLKTDADGKVIDCRSIEAPRADIAARMCQIAMAQVTTAPATDATGRPAAGYGLLSVNW